MCEYIQHLCPIKTCNETQNPAHHYITASVSVINAHVFAHD